jgi:hypothetical protein
LEQSKSLEKSVTVNGTGLVIVCVIEKAAAGLQHFVMREALVIP